MIEMGCEPLLSVYSDIDDGTADTPAINNDSATIHDPSLEEISLRQLEPSAAMTIQPSSPPFVELHLRDVIPCNLRGTVFYA